MQIRSRRGQRSVRSRSKRRRAVKWSSSHPRHVGLGEVFAVRASDRRPAIQVLHQTTGAVVSSKGLSGWPPARIFSHTSQRWTGTDESTSKPSRTLPPLSSSTVTLSRCSKPTAPPTTTDSSRFLDRTSMEEPPCSGLVENPTAVPGVRGYGTVKQENLHH